MFEAIELGHKVPKKLFDDEEPKLHTDLLEVQRQLRKANLPVIVIVSGVEGAGKGEVVGVLNKWLDTRGVRTHAFWEETDEERTRPPYWRFWRRLPARGTIGIMLGSWYTLPIIDRAQRRIKDGEFENEMKRITEFEELLTKDGTLIVKLWFHLSKPAHRRRLQADLTKSWNLTPSPLPRKLSKNYDRFLPVAERAIRMTTRGPSPWHLIEANHRRFRDLTAGQTLLNSIRQGLKDHHSGSTEVSADPHSSLPTIPHAGDRVLDQVDLAQELQGKGYRKELTRYQSRLKDLAWRAWEQKRSTVAVFEGWDASGKGGAIRRATWAIDARLYRVIGIAAPTDEEKAHHYLWRFWRHLPGGGHVTLYDRSWYGRVLVERVEALARRQEWSRAYQEINDFEEQLVNHGILLLKFWIHISKEEQLRRFQERERLAWKRHKITEEDWRNREKWDENMEAANEMLIRTGTDYAPWNLVPGNDKHFARVEVLKTFCKCLDRDLT